METDGNAPRVGAMKKRRVVMADGRRHLIYYNFGDDEAPEDSGADNKLPEAEAKNEAIEEAEVNENV